MLLPSAEFLANDDAKRSIAKQYLEQCEYDARKNGLIFVASQGKFMTKTQYNNWYYNVDAE